MNISLLERYKGQHMPRRIIAMLVSVIVMGLGISFFLLGDMGSDPFSTLNLGVASQLHLSFSTWLITFNIILLFIVVVFDRSMLGLGTIGNMLLVGLSADFFSPILADIFPPTEELSIIVRLLLTLIGVTFQVVGCSFYVTSGLGMAPYDALSYLVPERTKIPFRWWRIALDVTCVVIGFLCGSTVGIGTLIMAFGTGPLLPLCNQYLAQPLLKAKEYAKA